jgi:hypothetical protein
MGVSTFFKFVRALLPTFPFGAVRCNRAAQDFEPESGALCAATPGLEAKRDRGNARSLVDLMNCACSMLQTVYQIV